MKPLLDTIKDDGMVIEEDMAMMMLRGHLSSLFSKHLEKDEVRVLTLRFGLEDGVSRTVKATAAEMVITYAQVKNLLYSALTKLRKPHVTLGLREYMQDENL
mmetsp:Transcript_3378/g.7356  ORF Transcript_3378/g.7356 Transcript_3378/m.7356 type:complete len:102 (-) Transcript_3378:120-425(-)